MALLANQTSKQATFMSLFFNDTTTGGYVCIAKINRDSKNASFEEKFFKWPADRDEMFGTIAKWQLTNDVYFCPQLFDRPVRKKEYALPLRTVWADLDECPPGELLVQPTILVESSPDRFQAYWTLTHDLFPEQCEELSKRIAYYHSEHGADRSGWDLTQLLRIPFTNNFKRAPDIEEVRIIEVNSSYYDEEDIRKKYPPVHTDVDVEMPSEEDLPEETAEQLIERYKLRLRVETIRLFEVTPDRDWSKAMWSLELGLFEGGMTLPEVFVVMQSAACNKYERDNRNIAFLWRECCKAHQRFQREFQIVSQSTKEVPLLTDGERAWAEANPTIVEEYIKWGISVGDAAPIYHEAAIFTVLSALLAGPVKLPTSFGVVVPNLWFMILADTTLTRKTTAMDMGMDLLVEIDSDAILATDGSLEGLFTSLSMRPGRPSIFLRDEFSGLLESMARKEYYSGMKESFTKLYDGKYQKRVLRKEIVEVKDPVFILFAGGIRNRILELLTYDDVSSGFLPRFVFVSAESDVTRLRPVGPPTDRSLGERDSIKGRLSTIRGHYNRPATATINGKIVQMPREWRAEMTPEAWQRFNQIEETMLKIGLESMHRDLLTPSMDRLTKSGLKATVLLAAASRLEDKILITEEDLVRAFYYVERWRAYTLDILNNIGRSTNERLMANILNAIKRKPGISRSELMQHYHLSARDADTIFTTLDQRGLINRVKRGRTETFTMIGAFNA